MKMKKYTALDIIEEVFAEWNSVTLEILDVCERECMIIFGNRSNNKHLEMKSIEEFQNVIKIFKILELDYETLN